MTDFRFLHAADLHLGSPFSGLALKDADVAARFAAASRDAFAELIDRAVEEKVAFAVIAGDVYDGEWKDATIGLFFNREIAKLDRAGIPLFLLKGNHDADSVVTKAIRLPDGVRQFGSQKPETFRLDALKVALHGQSFAERSAVDNLALAYPAPEPGWFNIGVLHTSCEGSARHATYAPCSLQDLRLRGYDYWALGHVHEHAVLAQDPWIVFPGNLQGRSVRECGAKGAVVVDVRDGRVRGMERLIVDRARWAETTADLAGADDEAAALGRIEHALAPAVEAAEGRPMAVRVHLVGATRLHGWLAADPRRLADEAQAVAHRLHADVWVEQVKLRTTPPRRADPGLELKALDLAGLLDGLDADPDVLARADDLVGQVTARLPAGVGADETALADDLAGLLAEARALVLGRLGA